MSSHSYMRTRRKQWNRSLKYGLNLNWIKLRSEDAKGREEGRVKGECKRVKYGAHSGSENLEHPVNSVYHFKFKKVDYVMLGYKGMGEMGGRDGK